MELIAAILLLPWLQSHTPQGAKVCKSPKFANNSGFKLKYLPTQIEDPDFHHTNPTVAYDVKEDGTVQNAKVVRSTGSRKIDTLIVKSVKEWKFNPQPGCTISSKMTLTIDF